MIAVMLPAVTARRIHSSACASSTCETFHNQSKLQADR
jgi:hypothetical protein